MRILTKKYFQSKNTIKIAKNLLGKFLVRRFKIPRKSLSAGRQTRFNQSKSARCEVAMITEVEAYDGFKDKASHAHRGKTERNKIMFGEAGHWYVYFTYGIHWMLNIVTGPKEYPAAILIRSVSVLPTRSSGATMRYSAKGKIISGPARVTKALKIDKCFNGKPANKKSGLWIEDRDIRIKSLKIKSAPRIGVAYASPVWSRKKYRFYLK